MNKSSRQRLDHDELFKEMLHACFVDFLELFLPEVVQYLDVNSIEFVEQEAFGEITSHERRSVDVLAKARFREQSIYFLIHVEAQASQRHWSDKRMFFYFAVQTYKHDLPVYPIGLLSWDSPRKAEAGQFIVEFPDRRVLEFNFPVIQLNRLNWRDYLKYDNPAACALMAKMGVAKKDYPKVRAACLRMLVRLKLPERKRWPIMRFIDAYTPLTPAQKVEFKEEVERFQPKEKEVAMAYVTSWELDGIRKGKLEVAVELLTKRLGTLSETTTKRLGRLSLEGVEALLAQLLDFKQQALNNKTELDRWLRANVAAPPAVNRKQ
jgi:hypothetical protein